MKTSNLFCEILEMSQRRCIDEKQQVWVSDTDMYHVSGTGIYHHR